MHIFIHMQIHKLCIYIYIYIYIYILKRVGPRRDLYFLRFTDLLIYSYKRVCFQLVSFFREHIWYKALLMEYSVILELTHVCSLDGFQLILCIYGGHCSLFLRVCLLWSALPLICF